MEVTVEQDEIVLWAIEGLYKRLIQPMEFHEKDRVWNRIPEEYRKEAIDLGVHGDTNDILFEAIQLYVRDTMYVEEDKE